MTTAAIDWETAFAPGFEAVVCVLVEGIPKVIVPSGLHPTATAVTSGTVDSLWWPGTGSLTITKPGGGTLDPVADWLDLDATWSIYETTKPVDGDVECEPLRFDLFDVDSAATALLSAPLSRLAQDLASDVAATGDIPLRSAVGIASAGVLHVGREAIGYGSLSGSTAVVSGTGTGRGLYGSRARAHVIGSGTRRALAVANTYPRFLQGRLVTVWLCKLVGTVLYDPTPVYIGTVGAGAQVTASLMRWQLPADHITTTLRRKFGKVAVRAFGFQHARDTLAVGFVNDLATGPTDGNGWSASAAEFASAANIVGNALATHINVGFTGGRFRITATGPGPDVAWGIFACWDALTFRQGSSPNLAENTSTVPECVMHLNGPFSVKRVGDWDLLPSTLSWTATVGGSTGTAYPALCADTDNAKRLFARIYARDAATTTLSLVADIRGLIPGVVNGRDVVENASRITKPTEASLGIIANGDHALPALRALAAAIGDLQGTDAGDVVVDWEQIARTFATIPTGGIPEGRTFRFTGDEDSLISPLIHEARLRGAALCLTRGRIGVYRPAQFATTEGTRRAITEEDLLPGVPAEVVDGLEPIATAMKFTLPDGASFTWRDTTSAEEFGEGKVIECKALEWASATLDATAMSTGIQAAAQQLLGVLGQPQRIIRVTVGPQFWDLDGGDLVTLTHSSLPNWRGSRGLDAATCQVMERRLSFGGGQCRVQLALLLSDDAALAGYAPSAPVASIGGTLNRVVTIDLATAWGNNGYALDVDASGNAITSQPLQGFAAGDRVQLIEGNNESPLADETFTIVSLTATTVTLDATPTLAMRTAAATQYGCILRFAPWTDGAVTAGQREYLYIADATAEVLGGADAPKRWAA